jgi:hypothetical protein
MAEREYAVAFEAVSITLAQDLFNIAPAGDKPIRLTGLTLANVGGTADAGDAQEEMLRISIRRMLATVTNGTGGSTPTATPMDQSDTAAGVTVRANDATTRASTSGTNSLYAADGWNNRVPYAQFWPPGSRLECGISTSRIIIGLDTAPADAMLVSGTAYFIEV